MENKKLDLNSIIGFVLIFGLMMWIMYQNQPKKDQKTQPKKETVAQKSAQNELQKLPDSLKNAQQQANLGSFGYSATLPTANESYTTLENDVLQLKIANKGGYIANATLKNYKQFTKDSGKLVQLIKNNNAQLNLTLQTKDNRVIKTSDLFFEPTLTKINENQVLSLKLKTTPTTFLEYVYVLKPSEYMLDFSIRSQGLQNALNTSSPAVLDWNLKGFRNEKSVTYENSLTDLMFEYENGKDDCLGQSTNEETVEEVSYIAYKQQFFTSILLTNTPFKSTKLTSENLVVNAEKDTVFTKNFKANIPLAFTNGELDYKMNWYYGPADYKILNEYDRNLDEIISLGWGIFGWINKFIFVPLFGFLGTFISLGLAIIIFTVIIKMAMAPVTYKAFLSQAKMKVLRPEMNELNDKFGKDPMKKQQETMKLYSKAGVNPMAGCIPALIQMPFMFASFRFFPTAIELRQQGFLWADDLSSYDSILKLPFSIPFYGDHVSLFPILASIAIFFYMKYTTGDQTMQAPTQEGMPDMGKIMQIMIYLSPIMMLFFFNNYGSGLSLYNLISNLITLGIMFVIKKYIVDEKKIHAQIQENKLKEPKKPNRFQQKLQQAMEQAEAQKKATTKK